MKVLQITAFSGWGCTGRIAVGIHDALIRKGHDCVIAWGRTNTASNNIKTIKIGSEIDQKIHGLYTRITDKCGFASKRVTESFIQEVEKFNPDIIQMHIMHGYYINLEVLFQYIKSKQIPVVWTFHDCWAFTGHCPYFDLVGCEKWKTGCYSCVQKSHHPTSWFIDSSSWNWNKKRELYGKYKKLTIVTPSKWLSGLVKESFLKNRHVEVINNGIDLNMFKPTFGKYFNKYNLKNKKIVLGVSSTWVESKGIYDFYEVANQLGEDYQIVLVGLSHEQLKQLPSNIIGIARTDSVVELAEIYTAASVFVNPTYEDNYPTTNLEALACGTPVISYETGGSVEAISESGYGCVVTQGDIVGLVEAIKTQCNNLPEKECLYRCDAVENYDRYVALYEELKDKNEEDSSI